MATDDMTEVPPPGALFATVRLSPLQGMAERLGQRLGLGDRLVTALREAHPGVFDDDEALAAVADLNAPLDVALYKANPGGERTVVSYGALALDRAEARLSDGHRLVSVGGGSRRVERTGPESERAPANTCELSPAAGNPPARLVCAEDREHIAAVRPFLTRTLPRHPLAPGEDVVFEALMDNVHALYHQDAQDLARELLREQDDILEGSNPRLAGARTWLQELVESVSVGLDDLDRARVVASLGERDLTVTTDVSLASARAPLLRQLVDASRGQHPPVDLLARLPPGGLLYDAWALSLDPLRPTLHMLADLATGLVLGDANIPGGEGTGLHTAVSGLLAQDTVSAATATGWDDQGHHWTVSQVRVTTPPPQLIANVRTLLSALQRPAVVRAARSRLQVDLARVRVVPGTAAAPVPAGGLLVHIPDNIVVDGSTPPARPPARTGARPPARARTPTPPPAVTEVLLVPDGATLWVSWGHNARGHLRDAQTAHPAPVVIPAVDGMYGAMALLPAAVPALLQREDPTFARSVREAVQGAPDHGTTPAVLYLTQTTAGGTTHLGSQLRVPGTMLTALGTLLGPLLSGSP